MKPVRSCQFCQTSRVPACCVCVSCMWWWWLCVCVCVCVRVPFMKPVRSCHCCQARRVQPPPPHTRNTHNKQGPSLSPLHLLSRPLHLALVLLHPLPTCADAGPDLCTFCPDLCTLHPDLGTLHLWCNSSIIQHKYPTCTRGGHWLQLVLVAFFPSAIGTNTLCKGGGATLGNLCWWYTIECV